MALWDSSTQVLGDPGFLVYIMKCRRLSSFRTFPGVGVLPSVLEVTEAPSALSVEVMFWGIVYSVSPDTSHGVGASDLSGDG